MKINSDFLPDAAGFIGSYIGLMPTEKSLFLSATMAHITPRITEQVTAELIHISFAFLMSIFSHVVVKIWRSRNKRREENKNE